MSIRLMACLFDGFPRVRGSSIMAGLASHICEKTSVTGIDSGPGEGARAIASKLATGPEEAEWVRIEHPGGRESARKVLELAGSHSVPSSRDPPAHRGRG